MFSFLYLSARSKCCMVSRQSLTLSHAVATVERQLLSLVSFGIQGALLRSMAFAMHSTPMLLTASSVTHFRPSRTSSQAQAVNLPFVLCPPAT